MALVRKVILFMTAVATLLLAYGLWIVVLSSTPDTLAIAAQIVESEHVTRLTVDPDGPLFDPYQMPDPLWWQPQYRCRLQAGIDGYGRIAAPVAVVPFTPTVSSEPLLIHWDTSELRNGPYSVACRLELVNWMGDVQVFAIGYTDGPLQTVDGVGLQIVQTFTVTQGIPIHLPILYHYFPGP